MPYAIQTEWMPMMEALLYVLCIFSAVAGAGLVVYFCGIFVMCRNKVRSNRRPVLSRSITMRLGAAHAIVQ